MQTKKIFLMLIVFCVIFIFLPVGVWAVYNCTCNFPLASPNTYTTKDLCENFIYAGSCPNFCANHGGGGVCNFIDEVPDCSTNPDAPGCSTDPDAPSVSTDPSKTIPPSAKLDNPLGVSTVPEVISRLIKIMLGLVGTVSLVVFIYAGFLWITAQGKPDQINKGKQAMIWAVVGILVVFSSYAILKYVFDVLSF